MPVTERRAESPSGLALGIDTGGTFTDAVLYDEAHRTVVATAKSPTTHDDLAIGIGGAIRAVMSAAGTVDPGRIELVSLSTTLATNALVEGTGRPVAAVLVGFEEAVLERAGLGAALAGDPAVFVAGGHDVHGRPVAPLDTTALEAWLDRLDGRVEAVAVTSQFSVRNPEHELAAREIVRARAGLPVTCSHELSSGLNGPRRAVTAVLNARLVAIIDRLVSTVGSVLAEVEITAPVVVVRGDGSLVSAAFMRERPIETILSGPAASIIGAGHLTGLRDAVVSDIGGTTTDIAVLRAGVPVVSEDGATVGGHRTMVRAVAVHTHGLGGDSEVRHDPRAAGLRLLVGPRRVVPVAVLADAHGALVHAALDRALAAPRVDEDTAVFVRPTAHLSRAAATDADAATLTALLAGRPAAVDALVTSRATRRLVGVGVRVGWLQVSRFTPTDAGHVLGMHGPAPDGAGPVGLGDPAAAAKAATLLARQRDRVGVVIAADGLAVARATFATVVRRSAELVLGAAFAHDGIPEAEVGSPLVQRALDRTFSIVAAPIGLHVPFVGLGASAPTYVPAVAELLRVPPIVPEHAEVANAVGAVVGRVRLVRSAIITSPEPGCFVAQVAGPRPVFTTADAAAAHAADVLAMELEDAMTAAGAGAHEVSREWHPRVVEVNGAELFVEGTVHLVASGRPGLHAPGPSATGPV